MIHAAKVKMIRNNANSFYDMTGEGELSVQKICWPCMKLLQKVTVPSPVPYRIYLSYIYEAQMFYCTTDELTEEHDNINLLFITSLSEQKSWL